MHALKRFLVGTAALAFSGAPVLAQQVGPGVYIGSGYYADRTNDAVVVGGTPQKIGDVISANTQSIKGIGARNNNGLVLAFGGDSSAVYTTYNSPAGSQYSPWSIGWGAQSYEGWAAALSGGRIVVDPRMGSTGSQGAILRILSITAGQCPANTVLTINPGVATGTPANNAGPISVTTNAAGQVPVGSIWAETVPGSGYVSIPAFSVQGGVCPVAPTFTAVIGGLEVGYGTPGDIGLGYYVRLRYDTGVASPIPLVDGTQSLFCKNPPDAIVNTIFNNDLPGGGTLETIQPLYTQIIAYEQSCGARPINQALLPRTNGVSGVTTTTDQQRQRINNWLASLATSSRAAMGGTAPPVFLPMDDLLVDPTNASGNVLANATTDQTHPAIYAAQIMGMRLNAALAPTLAPVPAPAVSQNDVYNATSNPGGNLLGTVGTFQAGGTTTATGWSFSTGGTGTFTNSPTLETVRTDGHPGKRQQIAISDASGGGASDYVLFQSGTGIVTPANVNVGTDSLIMTGTLDVSGLTGNVKFVGCQLVENAPTTQTAPQLLFGINDTHYMLTSAQVASLDESRFLTDIGKSGTGSYKLSFHTLPILTQATATSYQVYCLIRGDATAAAWTATLKFGDFAIRKLQPGQFY